MATLTGQFISTTYFPLLQLGTADNGFINAWPGNLNLQGSLSIASVNNNNTSTVLTGLGLRAGVVVIDHSESTTGAADSSYGGLFLKNQTEVSNDIFGLQLRRFNNSDGISFVQAGLNYRLSRMFLTSIGGTSPSSKGVLMIGFTGTELSNNTGTYLTSGSVQHELYVKNGIIFPDTGFGTGLITSERNLTIRTRDTGSLILSTQDSTGFITLTSKSNLNTEMLSAINIFTSENTAGGILLRTATNSPGNIYLNTSPGTGRVFITSNATNTGFDGAINIRTATGSAGDINIINGNNSSGNIIIANATGATGDLRLIQGNNTTGKIIISTTQGTGNIELLTANNPSNNIKIRSGGDPDADNLAIQVNGRQTYTHGNTITTVANENIFSSGFLSTDTPINNNAASKTRIHWIRMGNEVIFNGYIIVNITTGRESRFPIPIKSAAGIENVSGFSNIVFLNSSDIVQAGQTYVIVASPLPNPTELRLVKVVTSVSDAGKGNPDLGEYYTAGFQQRFYFSGSYTISE
jgi:hypothetical protein